MHVVVVACEHLDDSGRALEPDPRADEHPLGARRDEAIDQILRQATIDLARLPRRALAAVAARVVDVHVEPVLVREVTDAPEARSEVPATGAAEVAHGEPWRARKIGGVAVGGDEDQAHETVGPVAAPGPVGGAAPDRIPGEEVLALARQAHPAHESPAVRQAERS